MANMGNKPNYVVHSPHSPELISEPKLESVSPNILQLLIQKTKVSFKICFRHCTAQKKSVGYSKNSIKSKTVLYLTILSKIYVSNHFFKRKTSFMMTQSIQVSNLMVHLLMHYLFLLPLLCSLRILQRYACHEMVSLRSNLEIRKSSGSQPS